MLDRFTRDHGPGIFVGNYDEPSRARLCVHWHEPPGERCDGEAWICNDPRSIHRGLNVWDNGKWVKL